MTKRKYKLDETVFEKIDSEESAYWLGFIFADGFITKRKSGQDVFSIKSSEIEPLEKIRNFLKTDKPVYKFISNNGYNKGKHYYQLTIVSNKIVNDLEKLGCVSNKSLILKYPNISKELNNHFIRGYFDGDGSVYYHYQKQYKYLGINICGTYEFLSDLLKSIDFKGKCLYKEKRKQTNCWNIKFLSNKRCVSFLNYIYNNSTVYLSRKRETFNDYNKPSRTDEGIV